MNHANFIVGEPVFVNADTIRGFNVNGDAIVLDILHCGETGTIVNPKIKDTAINITENEILYWTTNSRTDIPKCSGWMQESCLNKKFIPHEDSFLEIMSSLNKEVEND